MGEIPNVGIFVIAPYSQEEKWIKVDGEIHSNPTIPNYIPFNFSEFGFYDSSFVYARIQRWDPDNEEKTSVSEPFLFSAASMNGKVYSLETVFNATGALSDYLTRVHGLNPTYHGILAETGGRLRLTGRDLIVRQDDSLQNHNVGLVHLLKPFADENGLLLIVDGEVIIERTEESTIPFESVLE